jgi:hypothetical protein
MLAGPDARKLYFRVYARTLKYSDSSIQHLYVRSDQGYLAIQKIILLRQPPCRFTSSSHNPESSSEPQSSHGCRSTVDKIEASLLHHLSVTVKRACLRRRESHPLRPAQIICALPTLTGITFSIGKNFQRQSSRPRQFCIFSSNYFFQSHNTPRLLQTWYRTFLYQKIVTA